jgi:hypothetical protein
VSALKPVTNTACSVVAKGSVATDTKVAALLPNRTTPWLAMSVRQRTTMLV